MLGNEGRAFMNGISALIKEIPQSCLAPSTFWGYKSDLEEDPYLTMLALWSQISSLQDYEKQISVVYKFWIYEKKSSWQKISDSI